MEKPAQNIYPILDLLKNRWSPRAFSLKPVELEKLLSLFEAARWSPSGGNLQPWAFIFTTPEDGEIHTKFLDILSERNRLWASSAPVLVLTIASRERQEGKPNPWSLYDLGQAVAHLSIQATAEGISVHQMGGFDKEKARDLFGLPEGYDPVTVIALGYQGSPEDLPEALRSRELEPRSRLPLGEFVFEGHWDEPIQQDLEIAHN